MLLDPEQETGAEASDDLTPYPPFAFFREAVRGAGLRDCLPFMASWAAFVVLTGAAWAWHLHQLAGWSALPAHWGELLTARDLWEFSTNGGFDWRDPGLGTVAVAGAALAAMLWTGWRLQARTVGLPPRLGPWVGGAWDALLVGLLPLMLPSLLAFGLLEKLGGMGIQGLGWLDLVLGGLLRAALASALMMQWWFCRLNRAAGTGSGPKAWMEGLGDGFRGLWMHPVQWFLAIFGGVVLRALLAFGPLFLAWRWGGGSPGRVWAFLFLQLAGSLASAWIIAVQLRWVALFWRQDARVREALRALYRSLRSPFQEPGHER